MSWFFFTWNGDKRETWQTYLAEQRQEVCDEAKPQYVTILDCNHSFKEGVEEPVGGVKYRGPLYLDWDGKDGIPDVLDAVRVFMSKLEERYMFDLEQAQWFLSGGRGVHCTIPPECFLDNKTINAGVANLPLAYRTFAFENVTEYLDLRVYTGKRGRQWRTCYVNRGTESEPRYKVPISATQLRKMTTENEYWEHCKTQVLKLETAKPTLNIQLSAEIQIMINDAKEKIKRNSKAPRNIFKDWTEVPKTIVEAFSGSVVAMERDLNDIKLQLATAAVAVNIKTAEEFVKLCAGFIKERAKLTGTAHKTEKEISKVLEDAFNYVQFNPSYVYDPIGFDSILLRECRGRLDLKGVSEQESARIEMNDAAAKEGMTADIFGVIKQTKDAVMPISDYSWEEGSILMIQDNLGMIQEISAVPVVNGKTKPRIVISIGILHKPQKLLEHITSYGSFAHINNSTECQKMVQALMANATKNGAAKVKSPCTTEGYFVAPSGLTNEDGSDIYNQYWIEPSNESAHKDNITLLPNGALANDYMFVNSANREGIFGSKLLDVPIPDANTPDFLHTVKALLNINGNAYTMGVLLGWFTACLVRQPLLKTKYITNFPVLQIVGQAGSGKTTQLRAIMKMFPCTHDDVISASAASIFGINSFISGSSTLPVVLDEYKPQNLTKTRTADLKAIILECYTPDGMKPKGGGTSSDSHYSTLNVQRGAGPLALITELLDTSQTAIIERSVVAEFSKANIYNRREHIEVVQRNHRQISMIGRYMVEKLLNTELEPQIDAYESIKDLATSKFKSKGNDRIVLNAAMVLYGLSFFQECLVEIFPEEAEITQRLDAIRESLLDPHNWILDAEAEVSKLLSQLANFTFKRGVIGDRDILVKDTHYIFDNRNGRQVLLLDVDTAFTEYRQYMLKMQLAPAFESVGGMTHALKHSVACVGVETHPRLGDVAIFDVEKMMEEGISEFKS